MNSQAIYFTGAALTIAAMCLVKNKVFSHLLFLPFTGLQVYFCLHASRHLNVVQDAYFKVDEVGLIFLIVTTILLIPTVLHSYIYAQCRQESGRSVAYHNAALVGLFTTMTGVLVSANLGMMWGFLEATTLCATVLIYFKRDAEALEAAWKYVFVCSIGIAIAFIGILFLGIAAQDAKVLNFNMDELVATAGAMNPLWLKLSFILIVTGFSVKMGVMPLFNVDIDAKDAAPSPIGAILSGGLLNVGFVAIFRFYEIFATTAILAWMNTFLLITGLLSILFAAAYMQKVKNFKRLLAYSSLEHAGIVLLALASGGIGYVAMILHLILHSFVKASLFYQIGQVYRVFASKRVEQTGNYFKINPWGGLVLLLGFFCMTAMPPSGLFISEFYTFKALIAQGSWAVAITALGLLSFIVFALGRNFLHLLFTPLPDFGSRVYPRINPLESLTQWVLILAVLYVGIHPPAALTDFIRLAVQHLPNQTLASTKP
ncbi:MAG: hypothetical protein LH606_06125 [Cytophagaceae bacterium]|nr:hypothetical protein [Cytophagaceae bacterium]